MLRADSHVGQALDGLDDHLDVLPLIVGRVEERMCAQLRQDAAQLRLENNQHRHRRKGYK